MKISFLGDSITEGCGASEYGKGYVELLGKKLGIEAKNYGIGGTRIAKQKEISEEPQWDLDFIGRVNDVDKDSDFVFVFGGTNDYGHGAASFGKISDNDKYTFCGAVNVLTDMMIKKFGKDKLCFILPCRRFGDGIKNKHGKMLEDYVDAERTIISGKGIDFIDLYNNGFPLPKTEQGDEYTFDGLHPNDKGYEFLAEIIIGYLKRKRMI